MTNEDYPMGANQKEWRDGSNDPLVIDADTKVDITVSEQGAVATFRVPDLQTLDEIIAHLTTLRAVFGAGADSAFDALSLRLDVAERERTHLKARMHRLTRAITDCLTYCNGRQSEWGERAVDALAILEKALEEDAKQ